MGNILTTTFLLKTFGDLRVYNFIKKIRVSNMEIITKSIITCPNCGYAKEEEMPEDSCQFFYECENCKTILKPHKGDCCVFCSFGTVKCPSIQEGGTCKC